MDDMTRAKVATILGTVSAAVSQLAGSLNFTMEADVTVDKPWTTVIFEDGTRVRITAEVENVSDPLSTLGLRDEQL